MHRLYKKENSLYLHLLLCHQINVYFSHRHKHINKILSWNNNKKSTINEKKKKQNRKPQLVFPFKIRNQKYVVVCSFFFLVCHTLPTPPKISPTMASTHLNHTTKSSAVILFFHCYCFVDIKAKF